MCTTACHACVSVLVNVNVNNLLAISIVRCVVCAYRESVHVRVWNVSWDVVRVSVLFVGYLVTANSPLFFIFFYIKMFYYFLSKFSFFFFFSSFSVHNWFIGCFACAMFCVVCGMKQETPVSSQVAGVWNQQHDRDEMSAQFLGRKGVARTGGGGRLADRRSHLGGSALFCSNL